MPFAIFLGFIVVYSYIWPVPKDKRMEPMKAIFVPHFQRDVIFDLAKKEPVESVALAEPNQCDQ